MKILAFCALTLTGVAISCVQKEENVLSNPQKVQPRHCYPGDNYVSYSWYVAGCRKDCERGLGFRCGGYWTFCNNGVITVIENEDNCPESVNGGYASYDYEEIPTANPDSPRVVDLEIQLIDRYTARIRFMEPLPEDDFDEYPYLEIENDHMRWEHPGYAFASLPGTTFHYFQFLEGDYPIDTTNWQYGIAYIDIVSY